MKKQSGITTVEFAITSVAFMLIMLGAIEISRLLFTWNTLDAIAQRAARIAAVCPMNHSAIKNIAVFGTSDAAVDILPGFTPANIQLSYLGADMATVGGGAPDYVRAQIVNYTIDLAIPFVNNATNIASPEFSAIIPAESMGYVPDSGSYTCFGSA